MVGFVHHYFPGSEFERIYLDQLFSRLQSAAWFHDHVFAPEMLEKHIVETPALKNEVCSFLHDEAICLRLKTAIDDVLQWKKADLEFFRTHGAVFFSERIAKRKESPGFASLQTQMDFILETAKRIYPNEKH